jgi:trigger factor
VVDERAEDLVADFARSLQSQGMTLDAYSEFSGLTREQIMTDMRPTAANNVKTGLVLDAVAKAEGIEATDEEVSALAAQMAAAAKVDAKTFENRLRKNGRIAALREQIVRDRAADLIVTNAIATAPEPEPVADDVARDTEAQPAPKAAKSRKKAAAPAVKETEAVKETVAAEAPVAEAATEAGPES